MPPLHMFGRRWRISSDDFVCPAAVELAVRLSWVVILVFVLVFHIQEIEHLTCMGDGLDYQLTTYYLAISLGLLCLSCVLTLLLMVHSARGRIVERVAEGERHPRAWVPTLLYLNIFLTGVEFIWTGFGLYFTIEDYNNCKDQQKARTVIIAILVIIALFYVLLIVKIILVLCSFRPYDKVRSGERARLLSDERRRRKKQEKLNYGMLRCLAPCATDEDSIKAFKNIAVILNMVFSDKDLVPSDVLAGLILLSHAHNYTEAGPDPGDKVVASTVLESNGDGETGCVSLVRVCDGDNDQTSGQCGFIDIAREDDRIRIDWARVKHYYKFAAAAYGYMWWVLQSPVTHCCKLGCYLQCCPSCCGNTDELFVEGDGMFKPNYGAIKAMLNIEDRDVIVFDNRNMIEEVPYLMVADKATKSLVISIRGTLSLNDMLTDLRGEPSVIMDEEPDWLGHQGMVNAAKYVFTRLHGQQTGRDRSSRSYTDRCQQRDILACSLTDPEYAGYEVVVTGHSLGAGTATILAFLLRAAYPATRITCYAYSPPGGLLSLAAARESEKFCVSVVVGDDVIPRLSLTSIGVLARDIKQMIAACRLPKYQVFGYGCMACCCKQTNNPLSEEIVRLFPRDGGTDSPNTTADTAADTVTEADTAPVLLNQCPSTEDLVTSIHPPPFRVGLAHHCLTAPVMFLPGRILHIQPSPDGSTYQVTEQTRRAFATILVTPSMLSDHFPNNLQKRLKHIFKNTDNNGNLKWRVV